MIVGLDLGPTGLYMGSGVFLFLKLDFWCQLTKAADTKVQIFGVDQHRPTPKMLYFLYHTNGIGCSGWHQKLVISRHYKPFFVVVQ
jgi:hypothetical protein